MAGEVLMLSTKAALPPAWRDFVDEAVESMKLEMMREWAVEESARGSGAAIASAAGRPSLGAAVKRRMSRMSPVGKRGQRAINAPLDAAFDASARSAARRLNVDLMSATPVLQQSSLGQRFRFIDRELTNATRLDETAVDLFDTRIEPLDMARLSAVGGLLPTMSGTSGAVPGMSSAVLRLIAERGASASASTSGASAGGGATLNRGLKFRLHEVKCVDETNPEWPGDDEIGMGGVAQAPTGNPVTIPEFRVGNSFDDGDRRVYSPVKVLHTFSLSGLSYPADFAVFVALAEKDNGGLSDFIRDLWEAVKDHVGTIMSLIGTAAGAAVGAWIGGSVGTVIAPALGTIIGIVLGAIVGALIGWLISAIKDDIFEPQMAAIQLSHAGATFSGGATVSPTQTLTFADHGGRYSVKYSWELTR